MDLHGSKSYCEYAFIFGQNVVYFLDMSPVLTTGSAASSMAELCVGGMTFSLASANHSDISLLWESVGSCVRKGADSAFLRGSYDAL